MRIGTHEVQRELGRGGMGVVYAVTAPHLPRERALKLLTHGADPDSRARFRREAELLAQVRHPGVVAIHEVGEADQGMFLVMDLVPGEPLDHVLRRGGVSPEQARAWIVQVAEAVGALHARGLLHRDLKPANLILRPDGTLVLLDFGLARSAGGSSLTEAGGITGSPGFLAPEQARGVNVLTPAVDVHGLGTTLFSFLSGGLPPFRGGTTLATVAAVLKEEAEWPPDLPPDLALVARKALAKDPSERYPDALAFVAALSEEPEEPPPTGPSSLRLALLGGGLVLGVTLAALGGVWATSQAPEPSPTPLASASPAASRAAPLPPIPQRPNERASWYREAWARMARGESLGEQGLKGIADAQKKPLRSLRVRTSEKPRAIFWGPERWVRIRHFGVDWGRFDSKHLDEEGRLTEGNFLNTEVRGDELWVISWSAWRAWKSSQPGQELEPFELPPCPADRAKTSLATYALGTASVAMTTSQTCWESRLGSQATFELVATAPAGKDIKVLGFSGKGDLVLGIGKNRRGHAQLAERPEVVLALNCLPTAITPAPDPAWVGIGDYRARVTLWNPTTGESELLPGKTGDDTHHIRGLVFDPEGRFVYAVASLTPDQESEAGEAGILRVWRRGSEGWALTRETKIPWIPERLAVSPDGAWLLASSRRGRVALLAAGDAQGR